MLILSLSILSIVLFSSFVDGKKRFSDDQCHVCSVLMDEIKGWIMQDHEAVKIGKQSNFNSTLRVSMFTENTKLNVEFQSWENSELRIIEIV
jgi:hypothetical protein